MHWILVKEHRMVDNSSVINFRNTDAVDGKTEDLAKYTIPIPDDLVLQVCFNSGCNCECKFCFEQYWKFRNQIISQDLVYKYLKPLYPKTKVLVPTLCEITACKEGYEYLKWISDNYKNINVFIETNGLAFNEKWRQLAAKNLFDIKVSVNAISDETFRRTVWDPKGNQHVFSGKIKPNVEKYYELLKEQGKECFAPSFSCVLNSTNYDEVEEFVKQSLQWGSHHVIFHVDAIENDVRHGCTKDNEGLNRALLVLAELEKLLSGHVALSYKLFMPSDLLQHYLAKASLLSLDTLKAKYSEIWSLAEHKKLKDIIDKKNALRAINGKQQFTYNEEVNGITFHKKKTEECSDLVCGNPWQHLRFILDGRIEVCSWRQTNKQFRVENFVRNGEIDWNEVINSDYFKQTRCDFSRGKYNEKCMRNCPAMMNYEHDISQEILS